VNLIEAINKGIGKASGEVIGFLNGDDRYSVGALQRSITILTADPEADAVWGSADMIETTSDGENIYALLHPPKEDDEIVPYLLLEIPIFNACFFRKQVFEHWGLLMAQLKIAGDREFMLRIALGGCKFLTTDFILYHYYAHDNSMTYGNNPAIFEQWNEEHCQIAKFYIGQQSTPRKVRATYQQMHTNSNLSLIKISCKKGNYSRAVRFAQEGWRVNSRWPLIFIKRSLKILRNLPRGEKSGDSPKS
jgi:glycosyltransferase involved in cell wall biosynthesis